MRRAALLALAATLSFGAIGTMATAAAQSLRVLAPNAAKEPVERAVAVFERASGARVTIAWSGSEAIARRVREGEAMDVAINTEANIERLGAEGLLAPSSRTDFVRSAVGAAVPAGVAPPDIADVEALKAAVLAARRIAVSSGPSGRYVVALFERLGIAEQVKDRIVQPPSGVQIADLLARGEADFGFQQVSELLHAKGVRFLGPIPASLQTWTVYSAARHARSAQPAAADALLQALRAPEAAQAARDAGLEPIGRP